MGQFVFNLLFLIIMIKNKTTNEISIKGFHGTTEKNADKILESGFQISKNNEDWLGNGVYFFIDGISNPLFSAIEWASNTHGKLNCAVIESDILIQAKDILDLTTSKGLITYNYLRNKIITRDYSELLHRRDLGIKKRRDIRVDDRIITNKLFSLTNYKAIIHQVYIKTVLQRTLALESSYPNSTVLCIKNPCAIQLSKKIPL
ncbi:hypothetical protein ACP6EV_06460 [Aeromonas hydrophila]|uniref:hypothetical protein n=1 Tax=Aeromonas hydrophila TaxID=644 RepID=UPI003CF6279E